MTRHTYFIMETMESIVKGGKRGHILANKPVVIFGLVLLTLFSYSKAEAGQVSYTNVASTTWSTYSLSNQYYVAFPQTLPEMVGVKYGGLYKTGTCATGIYLFTFDIMASSSFNVLNSQHASFSSGVGDGAGGCRYTSHAIRTGGYYPEGTVVSTTTGIYLPAGSYWFLYTASAGQYFAGSDGGGDTAKVFKSSVPQGWVGYYDINYPTLYLISATSTVAEPSEVPNEGTRLVDFTPADGETIPADTPFTFTLTAYVDGEDIGTYIGVRFTLHNIDQNVLLLNRLSPSDFYILDGFDATTSGDFYYESEEYVLPSGNYRLEAQLERSYLGGWVVNPFSPINDTQSHQFVVGSSTYLGNLSQNAFNDLQTFFASTSATTTEATSRSCNPLAWNTELCLAYLLIPSAADISNTLLGLKDMVLVRVPWGYATRFAAILASTATTALPSYSVTLHLGAGSDETPATSTLTFDPDDMLSGGIALAGSFTDPNTGMTAREMAEPMVRFFVAFMVVLVIALDLLKIGGTGGEERPERHVRSKGRRQAALTRREYRF